MGKFSVSYTFHARASEIVEAESLEAAKAAIEVKVEADDFDIEPDAIDDVDFHVQQMHPVTRDGRELWTTFVMMGDVRGHQSALLETPLFAANDNQEAAAAVSVLGGK